MPQNNSHSSDAPVEVKWERLPVLVPFGKWAAFGVRDPSLLLQSNGTSHLGENLRFTLFFNARDSATDAGGTTVVGRATSPDGIHWTPDPEPVLQDGDYAAQGSATILEDGEVVMPYSPDTRTGFRMAVAPCPQGTFEPTGPVFLRPSDVDCTRIGLPFLWNDGDVWRIVFEGINRLARFAVYQAWSEDLMTWTTDAEPILRPPDDAWDGLGQANPSVHNIGGATVLLYNGSSVIMEWDVGWATHQNGQWTRFDEPILRRSVTEPWSATRLEGARHLPQLPGLALMYFGTPTHDPYAGATIGLARHV